MKDVTHDFTELERGLLFFNCPNGVLIKGSGTNGLKYARRSTTKTMRSQGSETVYHHTGEILSNTLDGVENYYVVYRAK